VAQSPQAKAEAEAEAKADTEAEARAEARADATARARHIRLLGEWRMFVPFVGRVLALQGSHPTVAAGIYDHSEVFTNPWRRAMRTYQYAERLLFDDDRAAAAAEIRELHRPIKGIGLDGRPYHAWNREAWTWVHLTTFEATLFALEKIHGRLPQDDLEDLYADAREVGLLYGVRAQDMPDDAAGLHRYVEDGIETMCTHVPPVSLVASLHSVPPPPSVPVPRLVWSLWMRPVTHPAHIMLAGSFPSTIRRRWGIRWSPLHQLEYEGQLAVLRTVTAPLPDRLRLLPRPYRALRAAS
jgi:uncharacterized protein (DUF2236 family)